MIPLFIWVSVDGYIAVSKFFALFNMSLNSTQTLGLFCLPTGIWILVQLIRRLLIKKGVIQR